jgi:hypothetical protein
MWQAEREQWALAALVPPWRNGASLQPSPRPRPRRNPGGKMGRGEAAAS